MNIPRIPSPSGGALPVIANRARSLDMPYRGGAAPEFDAEGASIRDQILKYVGIAIKHRLLIAAFCGAAMFVGLIVTFLTPKVYSASTTIKIDRSVPKVLKEASQLEGAGEPNFYYTQFELLKSRSLAERVATTLNLGQTDFVSGGRPSLLSRIAGGDGDEPSRDAAAIRARQQQAVAIIMAGLSIQPVPNSSLVRIRFSSQSPQWAQRISVAVAEGFERSTLDRRFNASNYARNFLEERLQEQKLKLQDSEKQLIAYAQQEGIVNVDESQPQAVAALAGVQNALASVVTEKLKAEQLWRQAQTQSGAALPQIANDASIQAARQRIASLEATYKEKLAVLKPAFPEMVALRAQITELEKQIEAQVDFVRQTIKAQFDSLAEQEQALTKKLEEVKAEVLELRGRSVEYTILKREVDTARSLYDGLLQQFREIGVASEVETNNVSIIDRAQVPSVPDKPSLKINLAISFLLGLVGAAGVIGVREILDDTFKSVADIEEGLGLTVLGVTPFYVDEESEATPVAEVMNDPTSPLAEAYRSLRTALQFSTTDGAPKTLLVTSSQPGEGKSTTSVSLAINFAQLGQKVLLIDGDMRNPSLHRVLEADNSEGLSNYLSGSTEASKLVQACAIDGVTFMSTGPLPPNPAELLAGPRFATLLALAGENFDIVIVDGPPVMGLADAPIIASQAGGVLLVVECARTRRAIVRDAVKRLDFARARLLGVLLNKFDPRKAGHSYGYGGGYGYSYGDGYSYGGNNYFSYGPRKKPPELTDT